ncbi:MAG: ABC transporter ATP-binding protein [Candidatus Paceibacterota bacterium]|jgi:ABC-type nitrate/sulfonate/bicarbonate transport system ATPase subunit
MSLIFIQNLSVGYGDQPVLDKVSFKAEAGEFVVIVGKSGSGKTTFLQALAKLIPFSGQILMPSSLGFIFQQHALFPWLTVSENIAFGLNSFAKDEEAQIVSTHLKLAGIENKKNTYPAELSGGQIQRVALARSLAHNPKVLLMDEPYGSLDTYTRGKMQKWLLSVWEREKKTIIFVTHDIEEAIFMADRILILKDGKFIKEFTIKDGRPRLPKIKFSHEFNRLREEIYNSL